MTQRDKQIDKLRDSEWKWEDKVLAWRLRWKERHMKEWERKREKMKEWEWEKEINVKNENESERGRECSRIWMTEIECERMRMIKIERKN